MFLLQLQCTACEHGFLLQDETTTMMTSRLLSAHQQMLLQEKQKSRELRRQKALSRQLEISNWGCVASGGDGYHYFRACWWEMRDLSTTGLDAVTRYVLLLAGRWTLVLC